MTRLEAKAIKKYFRNIRLLMLMRNHDSRKYIRTLKFSVADYIENHPDCTADDVICHFGTPKDIVLEYIESIDIEQLYKKLRLSRYIKMIIGIIILGIILTSMYRMWILYDIRQEALQHVIISEYSVIE